MQALNTLIGGMVQLWLLIVKAGLDLFVSLMKGIGSLIGGAMTNRGRREWRGKRRSKGRRR